MTRNRTKKIIKSLQKAQSSLANKAERVTPSAEITIHKRQIALPKEVQMQLQELFKVCPATIWAALNYIKSNEIHRKIRNEDLRHGGAVRLTVDADELQRYLPDDQLKSIKE